MHIIKFYKWNYNVVGFLVLFCYHSYHICYPQINVIPSPEHTQRLLTSSSEALAQVWSASMFNCPQSLFRTALTLPSGGESHHCPGGMHLIFANQKLSAVKQMVKLGNNIISQNQYMEL